MCYQVVELYTACRCLYYQHAIDRCATYGRPGHGIQRRTILVGYSCSEHETRMRGDFGPHEPTRSDGHRLTATESGRANTRIDAWATVSDAKVRRSLALARDAEGKTKGMEFAPDVTPKDEIDPVQPDSDDSDAWFQAPDSDEESIVSISSSNATTVDDDTVGLLFSNLMRFGDLRYLWPQLIARSLTWKRSQRAIERLLRRYSDDLNELAFNETDESITKADRTLRIQVSRFVRRSRVNIARRLCEAHYDATEPPSIDSDHGGLDPKDRGRQLHDQDSDSDDNDASPFDFDAAHAFLFRTDPILFLQSNVKALVRFRAVSTTSPWDRLWNRAKLTFENTFLTGKHRSPQWANSTRLHWKCVSLEIQNQCTTASLTLDYRRAVESCMTTTSATSQTP
ncbi:hypothetical protein B0T14DRAFT_440314 [Immersiella caudata]|uniref:Uncharacterized protein n=1 Tax=Immersiella caudata TaxID=314043 RepID=A0AA39TLZ4_9PEZI|nr:hypothetical protein B0T14DRAFT_440314 [Immersiella caudata]